MMRRLIFIPAFLLSFLYCGAQESLIYKKIAPTFTKTNDVVNPFQKIQGSITPSKIQQKLIRQSLHLELDQNVTRELMATNTAFLTMNIPFFNQQGITLQMTKVQILADDFFVSTSEDDDVEMIDANEIVHYRGIVEGDPQSMVSFSITESEIIGQIVTNSETYSISKDPVQSRNHILFKATEETGLPGSCHTAASGIVYDEEALSNILDSKKQSLPGDAVRIYVETDGDIRSDLGSNQAVTNYITAVFNQIATLYANEGIVILISQLQINNSVQYDSNSAGTILNQFSSEMSGGFNGDLSILLNFNSRSGGIAYLNTLCASPRFRTSYAGVSRSFNDIPQYSWTIGAIAHELGHLFGSQHTQACAWNGNGTAIDGCWSTEGSCARPGIPSGGGTIMSYCHLTSVGINLALGFGEQPGSVLRNAVNRASCLEPAGNDPTCGDNIQNQGEQGIDCGGPCPACPNCTDGEQNGDETGVDCGGTNCDPCPTCNDGKQNGDETGVDCGGSCPDDCETDPDPTCNDGEQNGDETGVDCGGSNCDPCPTCNDGKQNGDETGVDCGGSCPDDCETDPDPTCNDGEQNGDETGVDCGGSNCDPCPTCNDGKQNGDETGVDCGGSCPDDCETDPDPTCNDGEQNGDETGVDCGGSNCDPCPTCNDGKQNGDETGVDCGGSECSSCPTCNDGIRNQGEEGVDCGGPCPEECEVEEQNCEAPDLLSVVGMRRRRATLTWQTVEDASYYIVKIRIPGGSWISNRTRRNRIRYFGFRSGATYEWEVQSVCNGEESPAKFCSFQWTNGGQSQCGQSILAGQNLIYDISVYPNPTTDVINIDFGPVEVNSRTISIFDLSGKQVYIHTMTDEIQELEIDVSNYHSGMYFLRINDQDEIITRKIIIE